MSVDPITLVALDALAALMAETAQAVRMIRLRAEAGEISPQRAADELKPILESIAGFKP